MVAFDVVPPCVIVTPPPAAQAYEAMLRPQAAALPPPSRTAVLPAVIVGRLTAAMGACAACTALYAFTMPLPHSPEGGHEHWLEPSVAN